MRQVTTAPDGVGVSVTGLDVGTIGFPDCLAWLIEDNVVVKGPENAGTFASMGDARSAAWERFVERSRARGVTEHHSANGGIGCLMWRTE